MAISGSWKKIFNFLFTASNFIILRTNKKVEFFLSARIKQQKELYIFQRFFPAVGGGGGRKFSAM